MSQSSLPKAGKNLHKMMEYNKYDEYTSTVGFQSDHVNSMLFSTLQWLPYKKSNTLRVTVFYFKEKQKSSMRTRISSFSKMCLRY